MPVCHSYIKVELSKRSSFLVREAQLLIGGHGILDDFSPLNRLADDAIVNEIWEGTHPILCAQALKALRRPQVFEKFFSSAGDNQLARELQLRIAEFKKSDLNNVDVESLVTMVYELAASTSRS